MTWCLNNISNCQAGNRHGVAMSMAHVASFKTRIMPMEGFPGT